MPKAFLGADPASDKQLASPGLWLMMRLRAYAVIRVWPPLTTFNTPRSEHVQVATRIGSVRRMALDAARALLEESGPDALHLRAIAASTGTGVSTLYHYFADKNALLSALAIEGFRELGEAMTAAMVSGDYPRRVDAAGAAYIGFLYGNLKLYALMHAESVLAANEDVRTAERAAFTTYQSSLIDEAGIPADKIEELSLVGWTLGRGTASVILSQGEVSPEEARLLAQKIFSGLQQLVSIRVANAMRQAAANAT